MKLRLPKAFLFALVAAAYTTATTVNAENYTLTSTQTWSATSLDLGGTPVTPTIDDSLTVAEGATLTISSKGHVLDSLIIDGGTVNATATGSNGTGFIKGATTGGTQTGGVIDIKNGGSLNLDVGDVLGWSTGNGAGGAPSKIILEGKKGEGDASSDVISTMTLKARQTWDIGTLELNGYTLVQSAASDIATGADSPGIDFYGQDKMIKVSGEGNTIATDIRMRANVGIEVADGGELTISGRIAPAITGWGTNAKAITKTGSGTLRLTSGTNNFGTQGLTIDEGTVELSTDATRTLTGTVNISTGAILSIEGTLDWGQAAISNSGTIHLEQGAKLDISSRVNLDNQEVSVGHITSAEGYEDWLTGLQGHQEATYDNENGSITISTLSLAWNGTADHHTWDNTETNKIWLQKNGNPTYFGVLDKVTFGADAAFKTVDITEQVVTMDMNVSGEYTFNFSGDSTITTNVLTLKGGSVTINGGITTDNLAATENQSVNFGGNCTLNTSELNIDAGKTLTLSGSGTLATDSVTFGSDGKLVLKNNADLTIGTHITSNLAGNSFTVDAGSTLSVKGDYSGNSNKDTFLSILGSFSGGGTLKFLDNQTDIQPGDSRFEVEISNKKVIFDNGLTLGSWSTNSTNQYFEIGTDGEVTVNGGGFEARRLNVKVTGGKLTASQGILIGHNASGAYPNTVSLSSGEIVTSYIKSQDIGDDKFTMQGGTLTIAGTGAFGLANADNKLTVSISGGTIRTSAGTMSLAEAGSVSNEKLIFSMGNTIFDTDTVGTSGEKTGGTSTIEINHSYSQTGTITVKGGGTLKLIGNKTAGNGDWAILGKATLAVAGPEGISSMDITARGEKGTTKNVTLGSGGITGGSPAAQSPDNAAATNTTLDSLGKMCSLNVEFMADLAIANTTLEDVSFSLSQETPNATITYTNTTAVALLAEPANAGAGASPARIRAEGNTTATADATLTQLQTGGSATGSLTIDLSSALLENYRGQSLTWTLFDNTTLGDGFTLAFGHLLEGFVKEGKVTLSGSLVQGDTPIVLSSNNLTGGVLNGDLLAGAVGVPGSLVLTINNVPEPATGTLSVLALAAMATRRRRRCHA